MIKVLFLMEHLRGGGAERALVNLANGLDPAKFSVTVQSVFPGGEEQFAPHVAVKCLNPEGNPVKFLALRILAALGLAYRCSIRADYDAEIAYLESFATKLLSGKPPKGILRLAWVHCDMAKKPSREKMRRWYRHFHRVVCVSEAVRQSFQRYFDAPTAVLPNVIDEAKIRALAGESVPEAADFVAVGRLSPEKGFDRLMDACGVLKEEGYAFSLQIIGEGPEKESLQGKIQTLGLENITLLGYRENPWCYMAAARAVVIPSRTEGSSTVAAEALALGKILVATPCVSREFPCLEAADSAAGIAAGMRTVLDGRAGAAMPQSPEMDAVAKTESFLLSALREHRGQL